MARLPALSGRDTARTFERLGWQIARQAGSHIILVKVLPPQLHPVSKRDLAHVRELAVG